MSAHCRAEKNPLLWQRRFRGPGPAPDRRTRRPLQKGTSCHVGAFSYGGTSDITAIGNDYGYEDIFRRQLEGLGQKGDVLIGLSTSGNSKNVLLAFEQARTMGVTTVALTSEDGGKMKELADICLAVPSRETNHIQEMHITLGHILCSLVEENL